MYILFTFIDTIQILAMALHYEISKHRNTIYLIFSLFFRAKSIKSGRVKWF